MKILCSKQNLMDGINIVQKAVPAKATLPILEGILLEANDRFKLTGNGLEIGIECYIDSDILEKGSIVLNSKIFGEIIRRLPDSEVLIEIKNDDMVLIECDNSHFQIKGINSSGFPALPEVIKENEININQKILKDMIRQTIFAVGVDENRPILTGALLECSQGQIAFVSIDGFRLALRKTYVENIDSNFNVVIPGKTLSEIAKIIQTSDEDLTICTSHNQVLFSFSNCKVVSKLLEGEYLSYRNLIPDEHESKIKVRTKDILSSIERASLISSEDKKYPVKFDLSDNKLIITCNTSNGNAREELFIDMDGSDILVGFNPKYFIEALKIIDDEEVDIYFTSNIGPCVIRPLEGNDYTYMILPVRIKSE